VPSICEHTARGGQSMTNYKSSDCPCPLIHGDTRTIFMAM
jgi:hypothetical protein